MWSLCGSVVIELSAQPKGSTVGFNSRGPTGDLWEFSISRNLGMKPENAHLLEKLSDSPKNHISNEPSEGSHLERTIWTHADVHL